MEFKVTCRLTIREIQFINDRLERERKNREHNREVYRKRTGTTGRGSSIKDEVIMIKILEDGQGEVVKAPEG